MHAAGGDLRPSGLARLGAAMRSAAQYQYSRWGKGLRAIYWCGKARASFHSGVYCQFAMKTLARLKDLLFMGVPFALGKSAICPSWCKKSHYF